MVELDKGERKFLRNAHRNFRCKILNDYGRNEGKEKLIADLNPGDEMR